MNKKAKCKTQIAKTRQEYILFGLEECAYNRIGRAKQKNCSKRRIRRMERMIKELA